jgi:alpha-mannosidase
MLNVCDRMRMIAFELVRRWRCTDVGSHLIIFFAWCFLSFITTQAQTSDYKDFLSLEAQGVIDRLADLKDLPAPTWKFHRGDLPHGEAIDLDDSDWETARGSMDNTGSEIPEDETTWYRSWIEIPRRHKGYDLSGSKIWFRFQPSGDGITYQIIYFNGRRVALGENLEQVPMTLVDQAKPGEKILVAVKITVPKGAKVRYSRTPIKAEFAPSRPNPEDLQQEFVSTALIAKTGLAGSAGDKEHLEQAIQVVDFDALKSDDQAKFDASLKHSLELLQPFKAPLQNYKYVLAGNSHIDSAWLWPWSETVESVKNTFRTAIQLMREYPDYTFSQSAAQHSAWVAEKYPDLNEQIKKRVKEGRWELVGGMWVEPDLNMPDGESLVRQLLVGKRYMQTQYGTDVRVGWNPDAFGYNWQLPQIYKKSGVDYFVTAKLGNNETHKLPLKLFWWESPDGSKVLTYLPRVYDNWDLRLARLSSDFVRARTLSPGLAQLLDLYGVGDHGGGPTREILDESRHWMQSDKVSPRQLFGTAVSYFDQVREMIHEESPLWNYQRIANGYNLPPAPPEGKIAIPTWKDELYFEFHRGVFTTQASHKRNMRESEEWVLNSEKYASLAWLSGDSYPGSKLTEAWKKVLFNQFHDLGAGSGIGVIYKEAQEDYDQVRWATQEVSSQALHTISKDVNTAVADGIPLLVFNPLAWQRSGLTTVDVQMPVPVSGKVSVLDAQNRVVPSRILASDHIRNTYRLLLGVHDLPSMGYKVLRVVPGGRSFASDLKVNGLTLENAALRVTVDRETGCITSLYSKKTKFEALAPGGCGNQLQTFADNPKCCDAWNIDPGTLDHVNVLTKADAVEVVDSDPLRIAIRVTRTWQNSKFVQEVALHASADQVEIVNDIDWHETHTLLKTAFPLAASSNFATYEIPYGTIDRPTTRNNSWEETRFEVPAIRWADLGDGQHGLSLINETKYGYDAKDNVLRLSLLRSPKSPDPDADQGHHHFTFSLYPHAGDWKQALTERRGYEYNYKLTAMQVQPHTGSLPPEYSFVAVEPENVVLTAMKKAEDAEGLILRLCEWAGKAGATELRVPKGAKSATVTNLMEKAEGSPIMVTNGMVRAPIRPYEILSIRVDYPKP